MLTVGLLVPVPDMKTARSSELANGSMVAPTVRFFHTVYYYLQIPTSMFAKRLGSQTRMFDGKTSGQLVSRSEPLAVISRSVEMPTATSGPDPKSSRASQRSAPLSLATHVPFSHFSQVQRELRSQYNTGNAIPTPLLRRRATAAAHCDLGLPAGADRQREFEATYIEVAEPPMSVDWDTVRSELIRR